MHDGSVETLAEAVRLMAEGGRDVGPGPNVGDGRQNPFKDSALHDAELDEDELDVLEAFLRALSDPAFLASDAFAEPSAPESSP